jgi:cytidylate kinase
MTGDTAPGLRGSNRPGQRTRLAVVAIDGPAGAGKSTVARRVADALGYAFLDTGAMYRAATWRAMREGVDWSDAAALVASTRAMRLDMPERNGTPRIVVDGRDVSDAIRTPEVTRNIWRLDELAEVRAILVALQRAFGERRPTVAEGRDMGTVVFPDAACKVFLDASPDARGRRRWAELRARGDATPLEAVIEDLRVRDERSRTRAVSPLRQADDAVRIDTSDLTLEEAVEAVLAVARERL